MTHTEPWAELMKNPPWPEEILQQGPIKHQALNSIDEGVFSVDDDEVIGDDEELDEETQIAVLISEVSIDLEEDEVEKLLQFD